MSANAILCYICSGNISKFVDCWLGQASHADSPLALQVMSSFSCPEQRHNERRYDTRTNPDITFMRLAADHEIEGAIVSYIEYPVFNQFFLKNSWGNQVKPSII